MDIFFTFEINARGNAFIGSGQLDGDGIPPDFFSDPLVRKGFAYCFNYDAYLNDALMGAGVRSVNVMLPGMLGYDETTPFYTYDLSKCTQMLQQSRWKKNADGTWTPSPAGEVSLWDTGFRFTVTYDNNTPGYPGGSSDPAGRAGCDQREVHRGGDRTDMVRLYSELIRS